MAEVIIAGVGQIPVGEHWELTLHTQATRAALAAQRDAGGLKPQAMYVGNFGASVLSHQSNLGALLAEHLGLDGIEAFTVEAAGASGAGAFRMGYLAVASGFVDVALVVGVEKYTDMAGAEVDAAYTQELDNDFEALQGLTPTAQAALLAQRYLMEFQAPREALAGFPLLAHANAVGNPYAMFHKAISPQAYAAAAPVCDPLNLFDIAPNADGAAAIVLARSDRLVEDLMHPLVRVASSSAVTDTLALHDRPDPLAFQAAAYSVEQACAQAGIQPGEVDLFELSDSFSIYAALSLEAAGFARRGEGWRLAESGELALNGRLPISTLGGLKGRGHPLGATGVYQLVEAALQLRGQAGPNQVQGAQRALVQALGGPAATAVTHVLERWP